MAPLRYREKMSLFLPKNIFFLALSTQAIFVYSEHGKRSSGVFCSVKIDAPTRKISFLWTGFFIRSQRLSILRNSDEMESEEVLVPKLSKSCLAVRKSGSDQAHIVMDEATVQNLSIQQTEEYAYDIDGTVRAVRSEAFWDWLYPELLSVARYLVRTSPLPCWHGQEEDVAADIVQETVRRMIDRALKAQRGEASSIQSIKQMAITVVYNYYRDLKRHDHRLSSLEKMDQGMFFSYLDCSRFAPDATEEVLLDVVVEKVTQEDLFALLASEIEHFPLKQKRALLVDLANRMSFDTEPTSLQEAFLAVGIELRHYRQPKPADPAFQTRQISLRSQAYKRVRRLASKYRHY
jgi:hypothetical protein